MSGLIQMLLQLILGVAGSVAAAVPGPMETKFRKDIKSERKALEASGGTGLTSSARQKYRAEAMSGIDANKQAALAQLARGSATGGGESGQQQAAMRDIYKASDSADNKAMSDIRNLDAAEYARRQAKLQENMLIAANMGAARKASALNKSYDGGSTTGSSAGSSDRSATASTISQGVSAYQGASK
jgi:hypothetical protein